MSKEFLDDSKFDLESEFFEVLVLKIQDMHLEELMTRAIECEMDRHLSVGLGELEEEEVYKKLKKEKDEGEELTMAQLDWLEKYEAQKED